MEPAHPIRLLNLLSGDTTPELTFIKNFGSQQASWHNTCTDLESDHMIVEIKIPCRVRTKPTNVKPSGPTGTTPGN